MFVMVAKLRTKHADRFECRYEEKARNSSPTGNEILASVMAGRGELPGKVYSIKSE